MRYLTFILTLTSIVVMFSAFRQDKKKIGQALFKQSCASCHLENKKTDIAPPFQSIRKHYGLKWTIAYLRDAEKLRAKGDINAEYNYYKYDKYNHLRFPVLEDKYIIMILDYVDSFKVDTTLYKDRTLTIDQKREFIKSKQ